MTPARKLKTPALCAVDHCPSEWRRRKIIAVLPTVLYRLFEGRNAWHSEWVTRSETGWITTTWREVEAIADRQRKPGSVFTVDSIPALALQCSPGVLLVTQVGAPDPLAGYRPTSSKAETQRRHDAEPRRRTEATDPMRAQQLEQGTLSTAAAPGRVLGAVADGFSTASLAWDLSRGGRLANWLIFDGPLKSLEVLDKRTDLSTLRSRAVHSDEPFEWEILEQGRQADGVLRVVKHSKRIA